MNADEMLEKVNYYLCASDSDEYILTYRNTHNFPDKYMYFYLKQKVVNTKSYTNSNLGVKMEIDVVEAMLCKMKELGW